MRTWRHGAGSLPKSRQRRQRAAKASKKAKRQVAPVSWGPLVKTRGGARGLKDSSTELLSGDLKVCRRELGQTGAEAVKGSEVSEASLPPTLPLRGPKLSLSRVRERGACRGGRGVTLNPRGKARDVILHRKLPARQTVLSTLGRKGVGSNAECTETSGPKGKAAATDGGRVCSQRGNVG